MKSQFEVKIKSGETLKGWHFPADDAKANLNIITGMDEHSLRYEPFALWLNEHGINVRVLDAIGQGLNVDSVDELQIWPDDAFSKNVDALYEMNILSKENGLPTVHMGHSMGSFMTQSFISRYPNTCDKIIIMGSNGGQSDLMKLGYFVSKITVNKNNRNKPNDFLTNISFGSYVKSVPNRRTNADWLSYNTENVDAYRADPFCGHKNTGGFWKEFLKGMSTLWDDATMKNISSDENILIISGKDDPVGQMGKGIKWLYEKYRSLGIKKVQMKLYDDMRHEILNEDDKMTVYQDILDFIMST